MESVFGTTKSKNLIFAVAFIVLWGGIILWNAFTPEQSFSQVENRSLSSFPTYSNDRLFNGNFMNDMNTYLNDQFVAREHWIAGHSVMEYGSGKREINDIYIGSQKLYRHYTEGDVTNTQSNIAGVNAFAATYGMPTSLMIIPSSTYVQQENLPFLAQAWDESAYIADAYAMRGDGVTAIDVTSALLNEKDNYIFYGTDHHWTSYGAYLGYQQLARAHSWPDRSDALTTRVVSNDFLGTYHSRCGFPFVQKDTIELYEIGSATRLETTTLVDGALETTIYDSIYFPDYLQQKDQYSFFLGNVHPDITIHTNADTGKKLVIFKDSYAHCLVPMLMAEYSEIRLLDLRWLVADDYLEQIGIEDYDEALFLYSTDVFSQQVNPGKLADAAQPATSESGAATAIGLAVPHSDTLSNAPATWQQPHYYIFDDEICYYGKRRRPFAPFYSLIA